MTNIDDDELNRLREANEKMAEALECVRPYIQGRATGILELVDEAIAAAKPPEPESPWQFDIDRGGLGLILKEEAPLGYNITIEGPYQNFGTMDLSEVHLTRLFVALASRFNVDLDGIDHFLKKHGLGQDLRRIFDLSKEAD